MIVGSRGMFVGQLAMSESRSRVLLRLFVLAEFVMMDRLMVMLTGRMLTCLCHLRYSSLRANW
jgi:hypothetical protein